MKILKIHVIRRHRGGPKRPRGGLFPGPLVGVDTLIGRGNAKQADAPTAHDTGDEWRQLVQRNNTY